MTVGFSPPTGKRFSADSSLFPSRPLTPELVLVTNVLQRAAFDLMSDPARIENWEDFKDAFSWFNTDSWRWVYSYRNCCAHLQLEPVGIRRGLYHHILKFPKKAEWVLKRIYVSEGFQPPSSEEGSLGIALSDAQLPPERLRLEA